MSKDASMDIERLDDGTYRCRLFSLEGAMLGEAFASDLDGLAEAVVELGRDYRDTHVSNA